MPTFIVCSRSEEVQPEGWTLCNSHNYGEYDTLEKAVARMKEIVKNTLDREIMYGKFSLVDKPKSQPVIIYYVNELAPKGTYPVVANSYPYESFI